MGGVPEILKSIASSIVGGYLVFHATITNMAYLYTLQSSVDVFGGHHEGGSLEEGDMFQIK